MAHIANSDLPVGIFLFGATLCLDVVSCVLICVATLGIVVGLVDFCFLLSISCVLLILSRLIRATISVFFVPCCPVLLSFYLSYLIHV